MTTEQVAAARKKGWKPMYFDSHWKDYEGSGVDLISVAPENALENSTWYNLKGQRVDKSYRGVIVVKGKKILK